MTTNVLIFPCGSEVGLELHKSLAYSTHFNVFGGSSTEDHGAYVFEQYVSGLPFVDDEEFIDKINQVIKQYDIAYIFPAHDSVVLRLSEAEAKGELACKVVTSPVETCRVARSKASTYEHFKDVILVPELYSREMAMENLPVFLKPDIGQGSKGTALARTNTELTFYTSRPDTDLLIMEYLPGKEYTVDCFTDMTGKLLFAEGRERVRISNGISVSSASTQDIRFKQLAEKINGSLKFRGVWFFQVKENAEKEFVLMEIATRVAGTMGLIRCKGVNLPLLSLFDFTGFPVDIFENHYEMTIDRALQNSYKHNIAYNHVYLDFDDLVVFNGKVQPQVMAFVYQCIGKGIKVHLLTKHKRDLDKTLEMHRLADVFDEIIWIQDDTKKPHYITEKDAIFIDDSFTERKEVSEECQIPVFDAHMIESLMDSKA